MAKHKSGYDPYLFFEYNGEQLTTQQITERYGISRQMFRYRTDVKKMSVADAITKPYRLVNSLEYKGKHYTQQALAEHAGIDVKTLKCRLAAGWTMDEAVELPVGLRYDLTKRDLK